MAIGHSQQQHRRPPLFHIHQLENINHAYERYDNVRGLLFNNQPSRMGERADSSASWLDLSKKHRSTIHQQDAIDMNVT
eukprot:scaffold34680_cov36-Cyclotella_meneghiniana.AAC.1